MIEIEKAQDQKAVLRQIIEFMRASCESFDCGARGEARRLAVCILALVEDAGAAKSLLNRLDLTEMSFYDSSPDFRPELGLPLCGLTLVTLGGKSMKYVPRLDKNTKIKAVTFGDWWNKAVFIDLEKKINMTRRDITLVVAASNVGTTNTQLQKAFEDISSMFPFGQAATGSLSGEMAEPLMASVRQIAYEVLSSLHDRFPQYFTV